MGWREDGSTMIGQPFQEWIRAACGTDLRSRRAQPSLGPLPAGLWSLVQSVVLTQRRTTGGEGIGRRALSHQ